MTRAILAPFQSRKLFEQHAISDISPIFYEVREESRYKKIMRKLGCRSAAQSLAWRFRILDGKEVLNEAVAMWLSSSAYIPSPQMVCLLDMLPGVKWVYSQLTGTDHIDLALFEGRGIMLSNSGQLSSRRVAEMALASILAHAKRLPQHFAMQRVRGWRSLPCEDLKRQTVGIIGTGNIGIELGKLCRAIGMHVIGASRDPRKFSEDSGPYHQVLRLNGELEKLLAQSDHVVLALPLNQQTYRLIRGKELSSMKRGASLINVARGPIVDEDDLCDALSNRVIGAAYIDRPTKIPQPPWSRLYRTPNLLLTHCSSAASPHTIEEAFEQFMAGLRKVIEAEDPPDRVV